MAYENDVLTRNENDELAVRTVSATEGSGSSSYDDIYTRDTNGKLAVRVVGAGGGGGGAVSSVNGKTGAVVLNAEDVDAIPQVSVLPTASASNLGNIVQYVGATTENYTNGYFYKCAVNENGVGSGEIDINYWYPDQFTPPVTGSVDIDVFSAYLEQNNLAPISDGRIEISFYPNSNNIAFAYNVDTNWTLVNIPWETVTTQAAEDIFANMGFDFDFSGIPTYRGSATGGQMPSATVYFWEEQPVMNSIGVYKDYSELPEPTAENVGTPYLVTPYDSETLSAYSPELYMSVPYIAAFIDGEAEVTGYGLTPETQPTDVMIDWATLESFINTEEPWFDGTNDTINISLNGENYLEVMYNTDFSASVGVQTDGTVANIQQELENIGISVDLTGYTQFQFMSLKLPTEKEYENRQVPAFVPISGTEETDYVLKADGNGGAYWAPETGGGSGEIDWKTTVDLPVDNTYGVPIYTIIGGLPDGNYEFYWQIKTTSDDVDAYPIGTVTFKAILKVINGSVNGKFGFVLDGSYIPGQNYIPERMEMSDWIKRTANGDWKFFYYGKPWMTEITWYSHPTVIPECFKLSAIKNVDTGQEYIATGEIYDGSFQYDSDVPSYMVCEPLAKEVQLPYYRMTYIEFNAYDSVKWKQQELICANKADAGNFDSCYLIMNCGDDVLRCTWKNRDLLGCVAKIEEATGIFENVEIGVDGESYNPAVWIQFPDSTTRYFHYTVSVKATSGGVSFSGWSQTSYEKGDFKELPLLNIGATVVPQNFGTILQYTGVTNANYTNGYFYKASGTEVVVPVNGTITNVTPSGATVTIDFEELVSALMNAMGWDRNYTVGLLTQYSGYTDTWSVSDNTLTLDGIAMISLDTYPNVATFADYGSESQVTFAIENFQDTHTEIQNGSWQQVNVQPSSGSGSTALSLTLPSANWVNNSITVTASGVTASNNVIISPAPASQSAYTSSGVLCTAQSTDSLTFTCTQTPNVDLTVTALIV